MADDPARQAAAGDSRVLVTHVIYSGSPSRHALGPAGSVDNMALALSKEATVQVVSVGYDRLLNKPIDAEIRKRHAAKTAVKRIYIERNWLMLFELFRTIKASTGPIVLHCIFDYKFVLFAFLFALLLNKRPIFHVPHGMLLDALFVKRRLRKEIFCLLWRGFIPAGRITHIASSELEKSTIVRRLGRKERVVVIGQITQLEKRFRKRNFAGRQSGSALQVCFVGRVARQKNLLFALSVLKTIRFDVAFDIYGSMENDSYYSACAAAIKELPKNISVRFMQMVDRNELLEKLRNYDLMFAPTLGENHGHYIMEALGIGLPVLISDQCPWSDVNEFGGGWSLPLSAPSSYADVLAQAYNSGSDWAHVRQRAFEYFDSKMLKTDLDKRLRKLVLHGNA
jgi:glycosyltransferase involved in cell wall biosynthesis